MTSLLIIASAASEGRAAGSLFALIVLVAIPVLVVRLIRKRRG